MSRIDEDAAKLRTLADWFDEQDALSRLGGDPGPDEVQQDLRRIADYLSSHVLIGPKRYKRLVEDQDMLNALEQAGVDNWDGYSHAQAALESDDGRDED